MTLRRPQSPDVKPRAASMDASRPHPRHHSNGDEQRMRNENNQPTYIGNFTKCLPHDSDGFLADPRDYSAWVQAVDSGNPGDLVPLRVGPGPFEPSGDFVYVPAADPLHRGAPHLLWAGDYLDEPGVRMWETQDAGLNFDLDGPDAQAITMPPCPSLDSQELIAEMGELYWMALCRDIPFANWPDDPLIAAARHSLKRLWWFRRDRGDALNGTTDNQPAARARRRILSENGSDPVPLPALFRGVTPGERIGPYISQFLLIGNRGIHDRDTAHAITDGMVAFGGARFDQRVRVATPHKNYMTSFDEWLDIQNGADLRGRETYDRGYRFIATPRDLATYVHYDALYQAYLGACLILLGMSAPFDPGLPFLRRDSTRQRGFAPFGGPHILSLVTEVATRALKAVRYQKYNVHRRLRPEATAGWMYQRRNGAPDVRSRLDVLTGMEQAFAGSSAIGEHLSACNGADNWLLPMAFAEGSAANPAYGASHAAVAGACVTLLKAWFDSGWEIKTRPGAPIAYQANADGSALVDVSGMLNSPLTVEGELNKLAANIALGGNWAGVHYYSDYCESLLLGEQIAIALLEEQKASQREPFAMTVPLFDGSAIRI